MQVNSNASTKTDPEPLLLLPPLPLSLRVGEVQLEESVEKHSIDDRQTETEALE